MSIVLDGTVGLSAPHITSGTGFPASGITGALPAIDGSSLTGVLKPASSLTAANLTGALPAIDGSNLTGVGGGAMEFIATIDLSNVATAEFTGFDAASYDSYVFEIMNVTPATDNVSLYMRTSTDGGSSYDSGASDYDWHVQAWFTSAEVNSGISNTTEIILDHHGIALGNGVNEHGISLSLKVHSPHLTGYTMVSGIGVYRSRMGNTYGAAVSGMRLSAADVDAVQFAMTSGNMASGTISMYGVKNA